MISAFVSSVYSFAGNATISVVMLSYEWRFRQVVMHLTAVNVLCERENRKTLLA